ncbi:MAG: alpha/beta hydrolase [Dermatophilaceae bacterium]
MTNGSPPSDLVVHQRGLESGPTLILLHGLGDSGACWPDAVRRWMPRYRILTVDARGHGHSPRWSADQLKAGVGETLRDDMITLLEGLGHPVAKKPVLIGHSMGGGTAAAVAATRPDLVRAVVLEDPAIHHRDALETADVGRERVAEVQSFMADIAGATARERTGARAWQEIEVTPWAEAKQRTDVNLLATGIAALTTPWMDLWQQIAVPSLLVTGTDDVIFSQPRLAEVAALGNPLIDVAVINQAGHCVRRDNPGGYHAIVDPWLESRFASVSRHSP